jgi:hypothetical protein
MRLDGRPVDLTAIDMMRFEHTDRGIELAARGRRIVSVGGECQQH